MLKAKWRTEWKVLVTQWMEYFPMSNHTVKTMRYSKNCLHESRNYGNSWNTTQRVGLFTTLLCYFDHSSIRSLSKYAKHNNNCHKAGLNSIPQEYMHWHDWVLNRFQPPFFALAQIFFVIYRIWNHNDTEKNYSAWRKVCFWNISSK